MEESLKLCLISAVGAAVAVCCGLAEQCLTLQEEQTRKKRRISYLSSDVAQGDATLTGTERSQQFFSEMPTDDEFINDDFRTQTPRLDDMDEANLPQHSVTSPTRTPGPSNQTGTSRTLKKQMSVECEEVRNTLDKVANAGIKFAESVNPLEGLILQVSEVVTAHPLIPEEMEMLVLDFLVSNDRRAYSFLSLKAEKQIKWLETNFHLGR